MFKNGVTLKKDSWHSKFMKWMYHMETTEIRNFCPYFWAFIGTIALLPILLILKAIFYIASYVNDYENEKKLSVRVAIKCGQVIMSLFKFTALFIICTMVTMLIFVLFGAIFELIIESELSSILSVLGLIILIIAFFIGFAYLMFIYADFKDNENFEKGSFKYISAKTLDYIFYPFEIIADLLKYIWKLIVRFFKYIWNLIKKFYESSCPLINWK